MKRREKVLESPSILNSACIKRTQTEALPFVASQGLTAGLQFEEDTEAGSRAGDSTPLAELSHQF